LGIGMNGMNATTSSGGRGAYQVTINSIVYNFKSYFSPNNSFSVNDGSGNFYIDG
jgi:hypothetical protein